MPSFSGQNLTVLPIDFQGEIVLPNYWFPEETQKPHGLLK